MRTFLSLFFLVEILLFPATAGNSSLGKVVSEFGTVVLSRNDIQDASLIKTDGDFAVSIMLMEDAATKLRRLTELGVGKPLVFSVCGEELLTAIAREPISTGNGVIGGLRSLQATKTSEVLNGNRDCANW